MDGPASEATEVFSVPEATDPLDEQTADDNPQDVTLVPFDDKLEESKQQMDFSVPSPAGGVPLVRCSSVCDDTMLKVQRNGTDVDDVFVDNIFDPRLSPIRHVKPTPSKHEEEEKHWMEVGEKTYEELLCGISALCESTPAAKEFVLDNDLAKHAQIATNLVSSTPDMEMLKKDRFRTLFDVKNIHRHPGHKPLNFGDFDNDEQAVGQVTANCPPSFNGSPSNSVVIGQPGRFKGVDVSRQTDVDSSVQEEIIDAGPDVLGLDEFTTFVDSEKDEMSFMTVDEWQTVFHHSAEHDGALPDDVLNSDVFSDQGKKRKPSEAFVVDLQEYSNEVKEFMLGEPFKPDTKDASFCKQVKKQKTVQDDDNEDVRALVKKQIAEMVREVSELNEEEKLKLSIVMPPDSIQQMPPEALEDEYCSSNSGSPMGPNLQGQMDKFMIEVTCEGDGEHMVSAKPQTSPCVTTREDSEEATQPTNLQPCDSLQGPPVDGMVAEADAQTVGESETLLQTYRLGAPSIVPYDLSDMDRSDDGHTSKPAAGESLAFLALNQEQIAINSQEGYPVASPNLISERSPAAECDDPLHLLSKQNDFPDDSNNLAALSQCTNSAVPFPAPAPAPSPASETLTQQNDEPFLDVSLRSIPLPLAPYQGSTCPPQKLPEDTDPAALSPAHVSNFESSPVPVPVMSPVVPILDVSLRSIPLPPPEPREEPDFIVIDSFIDNSPYAVTESSDNENFCPIPENLITAQVVKEEPLDEVVFLYSIPPPQPDCSRSTENENIANQVDSKSLKDDLKVNDYVDVNEGDRKVVELPTVSELSDLTVKTDFPDMTIKTDVTVKTELSEMSPKSLVKAELPELSNVKVVLSDARTDMSEMTGVKTELSEVALQTDLPDVKAELSEVKAELPEISDVKINTEVPEMSDVKVNTEVPEMSDVKVNTELPEMSDVKVNTEVPEMSDVKVNAEVPDPTLMTKTPDSKIKKGSKVSKPLSQVQKSPLRTITNLGKGISLKDKAIPPVKTETLVRRKPNSDRLRSSIPTATATVKTTKKAVQKAPVKLNQGLYKAVVTKVKLQSRLPTPVKPQNSSRTAKVGTEAETIQSSSNVPKAEDPTQTEVKSSKTAPKSIAVQKTKLSEGPSSNNKQTVLKDGVVKFKSKEKDVLKIKTDMGKVSTLTDGIKLTAQKPYRVKEVTSEKIVAREAKSTKTSRVENTVSSGPKVNGDSVVKTKTAPTVTKTTQGKTGTATATRAALARQVSLDSAVTSKAGESKKNMNLKRQVSLDSAVAVKTDKPANKIIETKFLSENNELIQQVKKRWSCKAIPSPETNLTCANYWRKHIAKDHTAQTKGMLEGFFRFSPLVERIKSKEPAPMADTRGNKRKRTDNDVFLNPSDGYRWDGKRARYDQQLENTPGQVSASIKLQIEKLEQNYRQRSREIFQEEDRTRNDLSVQHELQMEKLSANQQREMQEMYPRSYRHRELERTFMWLHQQHQHQKNELRTLYYQDLDRLTEQTKRKIAQERRSYMEIAEQLEQLLNKEKSKSCETTGQDVTYKMINLVKAPCRSNNQKKSWVKVCLPADIGSSIIREDLIYDAFYVY